jgi:hypothetical protein
MAVVAPPAAFLLAMMSNEGAVAAPSAWLHEVEHAGRDASVPAHLAQSPVRRMRTETHTDAFA